MFAAPNIHIRTFYSELKGSTALHKAAFNGSYEIMMALLESGASANAKDSENVTPLHNAVFKGYEACTSLLIDHKADVSARSRYVDARELNSFSRILFKMLIFVEKCHYRSYLLTHSFTRSLTLPLCPLSISPSLA